jgi:hypothetical protein
VFTGRPWPQPGEPLFLPADTEMAVALAEEERDTCPACGLPKAWCRQVEGGRARFRAEESFCWAVYAVNALRDTTAWQRKNNGNHGAYMVHPAIKPGHEPSMTAGLAINGKEVSAGG